MTELLPCPFCGSEPWGVFGPHEDSGYYWVECHGPGNDCMTCGDWYAHEANSRDEAQAAWNRRPAAALHDGGNPQ